MSLMSSALGMMTGGASSLIGPAAAAGLAVSVAAAGAFWMHEHNARLVAQVAAKQAVAVAAAQHEQDERTIAGLAVAAKQAEARAATMTKLKEAINAAPTSRTCAAAPAIVALVDGMRSSAGGDNGSTPAATGRRVAVPGSTRAARR